MELIPCTVECTAGTPCSSTYTCYTLYTRTAGIHRLSRRTPRSTLSTDVCQYNNHQLSTTCDGGGGVGGGGGGGCDRDRGRAGDGDDVGGVSGGDGGCVSGTIWTNKVNCHYTMDQKRDLSAQDKPTTCSISEYSPQRLVHGLKRSLG